MFLFVGNRLVLHSIRKFLLYFWFQDAFNDKAILEIIFLVSYISLLAREINRKIYETSKIFVIMQSAPCDNNYLFWNKSFKKYCFFPNCYMFSSVQKNYYHSYIFFSQFTSIYVPGYLENAPAQVLSQLRTLLCLYFLDSIRVLFV